MPELGTIAKKTSRLHYKPAQLRLLQVVVVLFSLITICFYLNCIPNYFHNLSLRAECILQSCSSLAPALSELTGREMEVLELIAEGFTNAQIGAQLHLSTKTVANHISNILNKLQVSDRHQARKLYQQETENSIMYEEEEYE